MPELGPYGSVRGARGNSRPYRDSCRRAVKVTRLVESRCDAVALGSNITVPAPFRLAVP
jgi:hypothetical protein